MSVRRLLVVLSCALLVALGAAAPADAARVEIESDPEYVSFGTGHHTIFARGSDDALWFASWTSGDNRWTGWQSLGGHLAPGSKPTAISWKSGHMMVFVRSVDNRLWTRTIQNWPNTDPLRQTNWIWSEWYEPSDHQGLRFQGSPKAVSWGNGHFTVSVRGLDGAHYTRSYMNTNGDITQGWGNWEWRGGCSTDDFESISWGQGRIDTYHRGCDGYLYGQYFASPGWSGIGRIGDWQILGSPAATTWGANQLEIFFRGLNWELGFSRFNPFLSDCRYGGWCAIVNLGGRTQSNTIDVVSKEWGHTAVYAQGDDGNAIWDRWYQYPNWGNWWQVSATEGPDRDGAVPAVGKWGNGQLQVYWKNNIGAIEERWWTSSQSWSGIWAIGGSPGDVPIVDGSSYRYGIGDDKDPLDYQTASGDVQVKDPSFKALGVKTYRVAIPWNLLSFSPTACPNLPNFVDHMTREQGRIFRLIHEANNVGLEVVATIKYTHRNCPTRPEPAVYKAAVQKIVDQYGAIVDYWSPSNEPNYGDSWLGLDPDAGGPGYAAEYYAALRQILAATPRGSETAKLLGHDFHEDVDVASGQRNVDSTYPGETRLNVWLRKYKEAIAWAKTAGKLPSSDSGFGVAAALHPYGSVHNRSTTAVRDYVNNLPPNHPVWLTEIAAWRYREGEDANGMPIAVYGSPIPDSLQAIRADWLTGVLMPTIPQIKRVYWYDFRHPGETDATPTWDSALVWPDGTRRGAWWSYCRRIKLRC